jgi:hypothetical protein
MPLFPQEHEEMLSILLASCEKLRARMGGSEATKDCTGLITSWDTRDPAIFYLERNMQWARELLEREE